MKLDEKDRTKLRLLIGLTVAFGASLCALEYGKPLERLTLTQPLETANRWIEVDDIPITRTLPEPPKNKPEPQPTPPKIVSTTVLAVSEPPQESEAPEINMDDFDVYTPVEKVSTPKISPTDFPNVFPEFPGGDSGLYKFLGDELHYPKFARDNNIEGPVYVKFVVDADGNVRPDDMEILRSPHDVLSKEAIRVIKKMPQWKPGRQRLVNVPVYMKIPIKFNLE